MADSLEIVRRSLQLHLQRDDGLLFAVQIAVDRRQRVRDLHDAGLERRHVGHRLIALGLLARNPIAQFLDLAFDAENRAPFVLAAAGDERPATHDFAGQRRNRDSEA